MVYFYTVIEDIASYNINVSQNSRHYLKMKTRFKHDLFCGLLFVTLGGILCYYFLYRPISLVAKSASWSPNAAVVTSSKVDRNISHAQKTYSIHIDYQYNYQGKTYRGDRYDFFRSKNIYTSEKDTIEAIVLHHPVGTKITCLVNPENPAESVISREISYDSFLVGAIPLFFVILGIILLFKSARELFLLKKEEA